MVLSDDVILSSHFPADTDGENADNSTDDSKSPISAVHETAFKYNLSATFEVIDERGPPHLRTFITECRVGDQFKTIGEGNGKKVSYFLGRKFFCKNVVKCLWKYRIYL